MNINFPSVDEKFIKSQVEQGYYSNATELVRDAVRRLRRESSSPRERLRAALEEGEASIRAEGTIPYTPEFLDSCMERALEDVANGVKPDPDVCP